MKRTLTLWLVATFGLFGVASAGILGDCGCDCGAFEVFGEALYLQPSTCTYNFAIHDATLGQRAEAYWVDPMSNGEGSNGFEYALAPVGHEKAACPDYDWGFRIGAAYYTCDGCNDIRLYYSRLCAKSHARHDVCNGAGIWASYGAGAIYGFNPWTTPTSQTAVAEGVLNASILTGSESYAESHHRLEWDAIDLELGSRSMKSCDMSVRSFIGLHWTEIRSKADHHYVNAGDMPVWDAWLIGSEWSAHFHESSRAWGIGPRAGFDMRYDIACGFGVGARMGLGILGGEVRHGNDGHGEGLAQMVANGAKGDSHFCETDSHIDVGHPSRCVVVPELDAALGVNYTWCCDDCFSLYADIGWEFRNYWNVVDRSHYVDSHTAANVVTCHDFSLQGLYIHLGATF